MAPRARPLVALACLAFALGGCGGDDPPLTQEEALSLWATAVCNHVRRCDPDTFAMISATPSTCEQRLMRDLSSSGDPRCEQSEQFDGNAARACIGQLDSDQCKQDDPPEPCTRVCRPKG